MDVDMFLDGADGRPRDAVHLLYAEEIVRQGDTIATPSVEQSNRMKDKIVIDLESLVRMKLTSYRRKDQVHNYVNLVTWAGGKIILRGFTYM